MDVFRRILFSKIHRLTVTHADLEYEGSIALPPELLGASGIAVGEAVSVWNVTNGNRFETYTIQGSPGSGAVMINGAAAHLAKPGDIIIVAAFCFVHAAKIHEITPQIVFVDDCNKIKEIRQERIDSLKMEYKGK